MHAYSAYGLTIVSAIELPELVEAPAESPDSVEGDHVLFICRGKVDLGPSRSSPGVIAWARRDDACLHYDGVATFHVSAGKRICVDATPGAAESTVRLFLLGPALALLLHQRGLLVLHASAVALDEQVVAFVGEKGQGKSTLAAAMIERGHSLVSDDLAPIDLSTPDVALTAGGFPQLKLMPDAVERLGRQPHALPRLHPEYEKVGQAAIRFVHARLPLARIFVLETSDSQRIEPLSGQQRVIELVRHSYLAGLLETTGEAGAHFAQVVELARRVPVLKLHRRRDLSGLLDTARVIEHEVFQASVCQS